MVLVMYLVASAHRLLNLLSLCIHGILAPKGQSSSVRNLSSLQLDLVSDRKFSNCSH